jgi:hypothetical protein
LEGHDRDPVAAPDQPEGELLMIDMAPGAPVEPAGQNPDMVRHCGAGVDGQPMFKMRSR